MGKYMRKAKITGEVAVMEVAHQSSLGVRTRARTLALQRLQRSSSPTPAPSTADEADDSSYLQLRSRRLEKPPVAASRPKDSCKDASTSGYAPKPSSEHASAKTRLAACSANSRSVGSASVGKSCSKKGGREMRQPVQEASPDNEGVEASFGENVLDSEQHGDRSVRETTPCSLIRDSDVVVGTPGSTTRPRTTSNRRMQSTTHRSIPTTDEMENFFAGAEQLQQRIFTEKYNFDPVNDCPLPGRYEWVRLDA
uniref:Cyclin-dependent kinase inhibitor 3 n=1 Tax=Anthurium amnicola TaxID=1678845 RepID=A0A1D1ZGW5_9ARAE